MNMLKPRVARRIGQQLLHSCEDIFVTDGLTVMPVRTTAQVKPPAAVVIMGFPVVRQVGYGVWLAGCVAC